MKTMVRNLERSLREKPLLMALALVLLALLLYARTAQHLFLHYDDGVYVTENPHVVSGLSAANTRWAFTTLWAGNWDPVTWLSHQLDCQLFGLRPGAHHLMNAFYHALNAGLLFWLLYRATGALWRSALAAALFAVHPMNIENVAWVAERKSLLSLLFSLLAVGAYGYYLRAPNAKRYALILAAFACALMSKPMAVSLPLVLLLLDYWPLQRTAKSWAALVQEKIPLFLLSFLGAVMAYKAQHDADALASLNGLPMSVRLENSLFSYAQYVRCLLWPQGLSIVYPYSQNLPLWQVALSAVTVLGLTAACYAWRRYGYLWTGWLIFLITLVPVIGLVQFSSQPRADRFVYVPYLGLFLIVAWGLGELAHASRNAARGATAAALVLLAGLAAVNACYLRDWQDGSHLFARAERLSPARDYNIEIGLGVELASTGRLEEAFPHLTAACEMTPASDLCHYYRGETFRLRRQSSEAWEEYQLTLRHTHNSQLAAAALLKSASIMADQGNLAAVASLLRSVLAIDPQNVTALQSLQFLQGQGTP